MEKSYQECIEIFNVLNKIDLKTDTKLKYAVIKVLKSFKKIAEDYKEKINDINIEYCHTDEKGVIVKDSEGDFSFKKEDLKKREKAVKELNKELVNIETYIIEINEDIENLINPYSIEILKGILFKED